MLKQECTLNKPIYIGQNVLDDSKLLMGDFHYNFMIEKIGYKNLSLLFTDTDSLCYEIRNKDIYEIIKDNKQYFDLSDYPKEHPLYGTTNKKVIGKFKDEASSKIITEFCGLSSKCYCYVLNDEDHKKAKSVKKSVVKSDIQMEDYRNSLFNGIDKSIIQNTIISKKCKLYSIRYEKYHYQVMMINVMF